MVQSIIHKLDVFFSQFKKQTFKKGEILIRADDDPSGIFYLCEGVVRQYYISRNGEEITLNMFKPHSFFPMSWTVSDIHNNYYYEAMTECVLNKASKDAVLQFMKQEPDIVFDLLRRVFIGIEGLWIHIEYLTAGKALSKLISTILILGKRFGKAEKGGLVIPMKLTEKELGEYAGMYRETVSREFHILHEKGLILYKKGIITILDMQQLEETLVL